MSRADNAPTFGRCVKWNHFCGVNLSNASIDAARRPRRQRLDERTHLYLIDGALAANVFQVIVS